MAYGYNTKKKTGKALTTSQVIGALEANLQDSVGIKDSTLAGERQQVTNYYNGKLPKPMHSGNSKYVSMDVFDVVESMKTDILENFSTGYNIIGFAPQGPEDVEPSRIAGEYTDYVMFRQNDCYGVFRSVIHDGLTTRVGVAKVYWDEYEDKTEKKFANVTLDQMDMLIANENVELLEYTIDPATGTVSGEICEYKMVGKVCIEPVKPEELRISARESSWDDPSFIGQDTTRMLYEVKQLAEARGLKLDESDFKKLVGDSFDSNSDQEQANRTDGLTLDSRNAFQEYQEDVRPVQVQECYIKLNRDGRGVKMWKFLKAGEYILDEEAVDRHPFKIFVPLPISHSVFGANYALKAVPIQNARTTLVRGILDHTVITNNPRWKVTKGALVNPREMLENRLGGVVNVTRPDGVLPLEQAPLNPFVFQTVGLLDADKEQNSSISKLSQGLNREAISNQNSEGLIDNLVGLGDRRKKMIARNFANDFLIPLALEVYRLVIENEKEEKVFEVAGNFIKIDPSKWKQRVDCSCVLKLGYGEQKKESQKWLVWHKFLTSDPSLAPMYPPIQRYNTLTKALRADGVKDVQAHIAAPPQEMNKFQPPQPDPKLVAEVENLKSMVAEREKKLAQKDAEIGWNQKFQQMQHDLQKTQEMLQLVLDRAEQERKDFDSKTKAEIAHRELDILEEQEPTETKQTNIVSPNS